MYNNRGPRRRYIYVAASHPRLSEAARLAQVLYNHGHRVVSTWHNTPNAQGYSGSEPLSETMPPHAVRDLCEVRKADTLVVITGDTLTRGGRHSEVGAALAYAQDIFLLGPPEQVFHYHPKVVACKGEIELLAALG